MNRVRHNTRANTFNLQGNPFKPVWDELDVDSIKQSDFTDNQSRGRQ